ncbi:MAG: Ig-like domain-containing protein, partial [Clostridia bacterium]|nr:Ig-like domain-containing protein [Clostridia bacterium]
SSGTKLSFNTGIETVTTTLLDEDFESVTWPNGETASSFAEVYQSYMPDESAENPSVYGDTDTWQYQQVTNEGDFLKEITHNDSTMLHTDQNAEMSLAESGLDVVFPLSKPVSTGVVEISFDVLKNSASSQRLSFGLRDTSYTGAVSYDPMTSWSGSTLFGGYTYWSSWRHCIVTNYAENRTQIADGYANNKNSSNKPGSGTWTDIAGASLITNNYTAQQTLENNAIHSWHFVVDLDQKNYSVYLDGALKKTMNFIPGGGENGVYDAFTVNLMTSSNAESVGASTARNVLMDNIKVTVKEPMATVTGVSFEKYDGKVYGHSALLDAGTEKAIISFSKEMDEDSFDHITVTDVKNTAYTVIKEGNTAVIDFTNCLYPNTEYTITIGGEVADMSGGTLGKDTVLSFTSSAGETRVDDPVLESDGKRLYVIGNITKGQSLTAKTGILNTKREQVEAHLFVSAYKGGCLTSIKQKNLSLTTDFKNDIEINFTADDGFVNADEIKLILVNNLTDLQPMKNVTVLSNDAIASVDLDSTAPVGELMTATTQATVTVAVTTAGGRTGWELDPEEINKSYIKVDVDDSFLNNLKPEDTVTVHVDYYDNSYSGFSILYNDKEGELHNQFVQFSNGKGSGVWKTASFTLYDAAFDESNVLYGDDFRIITNDKEFASDEKVFMGEAFDPVIISRIVVVKEKTVSPFDTEVVTGKTGNIFFDDDPVTFTINLTDVSTTGGYEEGSFSYTVSTFDGTRLSNDYVSFTDNTASFTLEDIPFGAYQLELVVEYDNVYQTKLVDFSRSLMAPEVNKQFGTCLHLDSEDYYTQEDAKNLLDLVRAAGYGLSRSGGVRWFDIEPNGDGEYVIPDDIMFAHQYTHELGIDGQILLGHEHPHYAEYDHPTYYYWHTKPENREAYAKYCAYVVEELGEYVEYFGISGEFNLQGPGG